MSERTKWTVINPQTRQFITRRGKVAWTYDHREAEAWATKGERIVDAEAFARDPAAFFPPSPEVNNGE